MFTKLNNTNKWKLDEDLIFHYWKYDIKVPKWFITDFWSIPRILWVILNPTEYTAFVLHDYLYTKWTKYTKQTADTLLYYFLKKQGASYFYILLIKLWLVFWFLFYNKK